MTTETEFLNEETSIEALNQGIKPLDKTESSSKGACLGVV